MSLRTADNRQYTPTYGGPDPKLSGDALNPGDITRGWVTFEVPADARVTTFSYTLSAGGRIIFDLGR